MQTKPNSLREMNVSSNVAYQLPFLSWRNIQFSDIKCVHNVCEHGYPLVPELCHHTTWKPCPGCKDRSQVSGNTTETGDAINLVSLCQRRYSLKLMTLHLSGCSLFRQTQAAAASVERLARVKCVQLSGKTFSVLQTEKRSGWERLCHRPGLLPTQLLDNCLHTSAASQAA